MKKFTIIAIVLMGALGVVTYFSYPIIKNRYFETTEKKPSLENSDSTDSKTDSGELGSESVHTGEGAANPSSEEIIADAIGNAIPDEKKDKDNINDNTNVKANITPQHCEDDCEAFADNLVFFEYCQQACGISPVKKVDNCDDKKDLEKDYCLKDLAITKLNSSFCEEIKDTNIKKTCRNRISEEIIEQMK